MTIHHKPDYPFNQLPMQLHLRSVFPRCLALLLMRPITSSFFSFPARIISPQAYHLLIIFVFPNQIRVRGLLVEQQRHHKCPSIARWSSAMEAGEEEGEEKNYKIIEHIKFRNRNFSLHRSALRFSSSSVNFAASSSLCFLMESPFLLSMNQMFFSSVFSIPLAFLMLKSVSVFPTLRCLMIIFIFLVRRSASCAWRSRGPLNRSSAPLMM